ncbi:MAG: histidinol-phosphate transaminase [Pseudomonadota bacterium]
MKPLNQRDSTALVPSPRPSILKIAPYVGGKSGIEGHANPIKLSSNETPFGPSPAAVAAYREASAGLERYPDGHATRLKQAIATRYGLDEARIVVGAGSDEILQLVAHAFLEPGDEVIFSAHTFLIYRIVSLANGAVLCPVPEKDWCADIEAMIGAITPRTRMVFLANPDNPTGTAVGAEAVARLHAALPGNAILILDGAYAEYVTRPDYPDAFALASAHENIVATRTFSKVHGLATLRVGWALAGAVVCDAINRIRGPFNVPGPAQVAAIAALSDRAFEAQAVAHNTAWRTQMTDALSGFGFPVIPSEANFVMLDLSGRPHGFDGAAAEQALLAWGIIVRRLAGQGLPDALRISIGLEPANQAVLEAFKAMQGGAR